MTTTIEISKNKVRTVCRISAEGGHRKVGAFETRLPLLDLHAFVGSVGQGRINLIDPHLAEYVLSQTESWRSLVARSPFATGAMIAYEKPGVSLGKEIVYKDCEGNKLSLPTHEYAGEKGLALVVLGATASDLVKNGSGTILDIPSMRLLPVKDFPDEPGHHLPDPQTTIPCGKPTNSPLSRFLSRTKTAYVGPIVRGMSYDGMARDYVLADYGLFYKLGIVVEKISIS